MTTIEVINRNGQKEIVDTYDSFQDALVDLRTHWREDDDFAIFIFYSPCPDRILATVQKHPDNPSLFDPKNEQGKSFARCFVNYEIGEDGRYAKTLVTF